MTPAILYTRWSQRPNAADCLSTETQLTRLRAYAAAKGYPIAAELHDEDISGAEASNRPGLLEALALAKAQRAVLCVYKLDRFARNTEDTLRLIRELRERKADLAFVADDVNTRGPYGKIFLTLLAMFAEFERNMIVTRTRDAMQHHQANGRRMTRLDRCPYGMMPDENRPKIIKRDDQGQLISELPARMVPNTTEQEILADIRQMRGQG